MLGEEPEVRVDYLALVDPDTLEPVDVARRGVIAMVAARVGSTRLIDNVIFTD
jgi:pantoate--beta-alanine ligase